MNSITVVPEKDRDLWELRVPCFCNSVFHFDYLIAGIFVYTLREVVREYIDAEC